MKNDRLRFRAWDPQKQCYYDDFLVRSDGDGAMYSPLEEGEDEGRLIIEQCTGLKDKNEKLIYEGDVIKVTNLANKYVLNTPVIWEKDIGAFMVWGNKEKTYGNYIGALMEEDDDGIVHYMVEVIGNIHENS